MNSVVSKVVGMVATVACLALVLNRPAGAEDPAKPEVKQQAQVVVVQADGETDIADAVKKALDEKLKGLPKEVQEQIRQQLKGVKLHQPLKIHKTLAVTSDTVKSAKDGKSAKDAEKKSAEQVEVFVIKSDDETGESKANVKIEAKAYVVEGEGGARTIKVIAPDGKAQTADRTIAKGDSLKKLKAVGADKARAIRIITAKAGAAESQAEDAAERITKARKLVEAKLKHAVEAHKSADGEKKAYAIAIAVDGDDVSAKETTKEFKVMIKDGKVFINGKPVTELKHAGRKEIRVEVVGDAKPGDKKDARRRMLFMGKDGKVQEFDFDVNVEQVVVDKADKDADKEGPHAVWIQKHQGLPDDNSKKELRVRALQLGTGAHAIHIGQVDKPPADVAKRLKSIESELKKIRQLLQKLQDDDEDDKGNDDKGEDDGEHEHEHAQGHDHEHDE